ncbi:MAG: hypothetical protein RL228_793 [Actinomycetota bacterium]
MHKRGVRQMDNYNYCPPVTSSTTTETEESSSNQFRVRLADFEGPFDLLLHLISKQKLEVTVLALHEVTDEFIAHIKDQGVNWDLNEATEFLVIAATLLDFKAARLLPSGEVEDEEDLAVLEARDLLFARLLQYKAFKEVAALFASSMEAESHRYYRNVALEEPYKSLLPEVLISITPEQLAAIAIATFAPAPKAPEVGLTHLHNPLVSVREQAIAIAATVKRRKITTFRTLVADAEHTMVIVARFLAVLELYRERLIAFEQSVALGELTIRWIGSEDLDIEAIETEEFVDETESDEND